MPEAEIPAGFSGASAPSGFPDVAMLERMANAFFQAVPGGGVGSPFAAPASEAVAPPSASPAAPVSTGSAHAPAIAGIGLAPPSVPVPPPIPVTSRIVPIAPMPGPLSAVPTRPDPNLASIADQHRSAEPGLYVAGFRSSQPSVAPMPIPTLGQELPDEAELRALLGGSVAPSAGGGVSPSHGRSLSGGTASVPASPLPAPYFLKSPGVAASAPSATHQSPAGRGVPSTTGFNPALVRRDFPILNERVNGKPLIWLDNAATTQKPRAVIDRLSYFYEHENSNIHRAAHTLAGRATDAYEAAREEVRRFLNAGSTDEIVFVRGTTEAINLVAETWGRANIGPGDEIVITWLEHHANIVPWHRLAASVGAKLRVAPVDDNGDIIIADYAKLLGPRTKLVSLTQVSNALGTVTPAALMVAMAHAAGAKVLVDGAQSVSHMRTDVIALDADWFVFSGHKVFGPTGIGALYGKKAILDEMPPYQSGGNMIADVTFEEISYQPPPFLFEAGTGNIADAVGLFAALAYVSQLGMEHVAAHEHGLIEDCVRQLTPISGVRIIGNPTERAGVVSFVIDGLKTEDVGKALSRDGIAVRSGHHCAQPILRRFGLESSVRPSFAIYNTHDDIDALIRSVWRIKSGL